MKKDLIDIIDQIPGVWGYKNADLVYEFANNELLEEVGIKEAKQIIGKSIKDIHAEFSSLAKQIEEHDRQILENGKTLKLLYIHRNKESKWKAFLVSKKPIFNKKTNKIDGIAFNGTDVTNSPIVDIGSSLLNLANLERSKFFAESACYIVDLGYKFDDLTVRQQEVMFFLIRGKNSQYIADALGSSVRTIYEHIDNLKEKFCVQNRYDLVDKAINMGYLNLLPKGFL